MNTTNNISTNNPINFEPLKPNHTDALPIDVMQLILLSTNNKQRKNLSLVNKDWNKATINIAKNLAFLSINSCIMALGQNYEIKRNAILEAIKKIQIENLPQVQTKTDDLHEKIIHILKDLPMLELSVLSTKVPTQHLKNNLFALTTTHKDIDAIVKSKTSDIKIYKILEVLLESGQLSKIAEFSFERFSPESSYKNSIISALTHKLQDLPTYRQIKIVTRFIENLITHKDTTQLKNFLCEQSKLINKICIFASKMDDFDLQYPAFGNILGDLLNYKDPSSSIRSEALGIASRLPSSILASISMRLFKDGKKEKALKVAQEIQDPILKKSTLECIQGPSFFDWLFM